MKQGTYLTANQAFTMRKEGAKGRSVQVNVGDVFIVTSPSYLNNGSALIAREQGAVIGQGYRLTTEQISYLFDIEA